VKVIHFIDGIDLFRVVGLVLDGETILKAFHSGLRGTETVERVIEKRR
jgi:hypothetical protein